MTYAAFKAVSDRFLRGTCVDIKVLPFKTLAYETAQAEKDLSSCLHLPTYDPTFRFQWCGGQNIGTLFSLA